jgi:uncharacterized protein (DUF2252 family)
MFDVNDFDETLPGPFEYDVERMSASFTIAGRGNGFSRPDAHEATLASVRAYREAMASFARMGTMDIWYAHLDEDELLATIRAAETGTARHAKAAKKLEKADKKDKAGKKQVWRIAKQEKAEKNKDKVSKRAERGAEKTADKAYTHDSSQALSKRANSSTGSTGLPASRRSSSPARDLAATFGLSPDQVMPALHDQFHAYRATLQDDRRKLLERFELVDMARKVVGVGSVGTRCYIVLLQGRDARDPLFLQVKRRPRQSWRRTCARAATRSTASGWCRDSG